MDHANAMHGPLERPLSIATGGAVPLRGKLNVNVGVGVNAITVLAFNPGGGGYNAAALTYGVGNVWSGFDMNSILFTPTPDTWLPTRGTLGLSDVTKQLDRGGVVRVLQLPQNLVTPVAPSLTEQDAIIAYIRGHPKTHTYGRELGEAPHYWHSHVVDGIKAQEFDDTRTTVLQFTDQLDNPRFSTLLVLFESYAVARSFEITMVVTGYARYPAIGPLASLQKPIPSISHDAYMAANRALADMGSAANAVGDGVMRGLGDVARGATRMLGARALAGGMARLALTAG